MDNSNRPKLVLIDGHALAYQQYFALSVEQFTTSKGEPTNATYGFARTLLTLLETKPPIDYLAVTFDQGMSGREELYSPYKGTRAKMEGDMLAQMDRIRELVQAFNIPILEKDNYEADDVIGTTAKQATAEGADVMIITGDRDLLQLVDDHVLVQLPSRKGKMGPQLYDTARVIEEYGIRPDQIPDYKGFVGDNSDNIPGVKGIGEKTAAELLQKYDTLENVYQHIDEQKGKRRELLEAGKDSAYLSKNLARIMTNIPLRLELEKCKAHDYDHARVLQLFRNLEFRTFANRLTTLVQGGGTSSPVAGSQQMNLFESPDTATPSVPPVEPLETHIVDTVIVDTEEGLAELVKVLDNAATIAFDTETDSTEQVRATLVGISLAVDESKGYYIPVGHVAGDGALTPLRQLPLDHVIAAIRPAMTDLRKAKYAHNAVYDLVVLRRHGLAVTPIIFDTMIAEGILNPESRHKGLKDQAELRLGVTMTHIQELIGKGKNQITMDGVPIEKAAPYAAADAAITFRLVNVMRPALDEKRLWTLFSEIEMPLVPVIADMIMAGARLDTAYLKELSRELTERLKSYEQAIYREAGEEFNIGSLKQLNVLFFEKLGLPTKGLSKTIHGYSIDADVLESLRSYHPVVELIVEWRSLEKLRNTYVDAMPKMVDSENRIHTTYNQTGSVTGRISSENPNLQNIPVRTEEGRRVRKAFIAAEGYQLLSVDYSQIELRILADVSKDPFLVEAFLYDRDIHRATAAAVFGIPYDQVTKDQRYLAKRVNFGLLYGMGAFRLTKETGISMAEADAFIKTYFERLPGIQQYFDGSKKMAYEQGYLETKLGRRRYFPGLGTPGGDRHVSSAIRARAEREAINMPIQGTAADIIKIAMIRLSARLKAEKPRARLILQVHDELVLEVPEDDIQETAALVKEVMESAFPLAVPLKAEANCGTNWAEVEPVEPVQPGAQAG
jgi:DNA polymerase-1